MTTTNLPDADDIHTASLLARTLDLDESTALTLTQHPHRGVRVNLAANPSITAAVQHVLVQGHWLVRSYLAQNPALLPELQPGLASDSSSVVLMTLALNPALDLHEGLAYAFLESFERGQDFITRTATGAGVDPEALETLRQDWSGNLEELVTTALEFASA